MRHKHIAVPLVLLCFSAVLNAQTVRFHTNLGDIDVALTPAVAPLTVANFLSYANKGTYTNTIFHRSVSGFIIQGGGFQLQGNSRVASPQDPAVKNEFNVSNTRGTIAMAKLGNDPNSATNQWFFNLGDNGANLDGQNGGFTVFGKVTNNAGLAVMDKISGQPVFNLGSPFDSIPLTGGYKGNNAPVVAANYVTVISITQLVPTVLPGGVQSAASFASSSDSGISPGEFLALYGQNLGASSLSTLTIDSNGAVSANLTGTRVLFDGTPAPMVYTLPTQLSVVVPYSVAGKKTVKVVVEYQGFQGPAVELPVAPSNPAIFTLTSNGTGDGAIIQLDGSVVSSTNPASPGDILELFGEGQGVTAPQLADGELVGSTLPRPTSPITLLINGQVVPTLYTGGSPSLVNGVLQVNFKVPQLAPGTHQIQLQSGDRTSPTGVTLQTK